jgi:hypothetical protein
MSLSELLRATAAERIGQVLDRRLTAAGIAGRADRFYRLAAGDLATTPDGYAVRVSTWRHWSDASEIRDLERGDVLGWRLDRLADPPTGRRLTLEQAADAVAAVEPLPEDARVGSFRHLERSPGVLLAAIEWVRVVDGVRVDGDVIRAEVHPDTRALVSYFRKWRTLRPGWPE